MRQQDGQSIPDSNPGLATLPCLSTSLCDCLHPDDIIGRQYLTTPEASAGGGF
ncbi:Uncharacterized protein DAT39_022844 [Clarias magur]|uniref:Uncharacterized protein n=1 Tax=Clarias magur TaxID=1594786 RepID=A0A8J4TD00_CLAMG|nr:Uncharacterized protein DAT39_022844 [Clarias magur]